MCELVARFVREWCDLLGDAPLWPAGVSFTYESLCAFCGLRETRSAVAPDAEAAARASELFVALASGRYCEAEESEAAFCEFYERDVRARLGADYHECVELRDGFQRAARGLHDTYTPRFPYVCRVERCGCENQKPESLRGVA